MKTIDNIIFNSITIEEDVSSKGFSKLPFIAPENVELLSDYYNGLPKAFEKGFHPSMFLNDPALKSQISHKICSILEPYIKENFKGYRILYGNFMVKEPGRESNMKLHQDWTYVNEPDLESYAIWFPLQDLTTDNGALCMIPTSHKFMNTVRGVGTTCPFEEQSDKVVADFGQPLYLEKGEPVIWQHRVLHYSPPNYSAVPRVAVTAILVPKKATVFHYYKENGTNEIEKYKVEDPFYFNYSIGERPSKYVSLVSKSAAVNAQYNWQDIQLTLKGLPKGKLIPWWKKLINNFK